jgi:hypothetical protein
VWKSLLLPGVVIGAESDLAEDAGVETSAPLVGLLVGSGRSLVVLDLDIQSFSKLAGAAKDGTGESVLCPKADAIVRQVGAGQGSKCNVDHCYYHAITAFITVALLACDVRGRNRKRGCFSF